MKISFQRGLLVVGQTREATPYESFSPSQFGDPLELQDNTSISQVFLSLFCAMLLKGTINVRSYDFLERIAYRIGFDDHWIPKIFISLGIQCWLAQGKRRKKTSTPP